MHLRLVNENEINLSWYRFYLPKHPPEGQAVVSLWRQQGEGNRIWHNHNNQDRSSWLGSQILRLLAAHGRPCSINVRCCDLEQAMGAAEEIGQELGYVLFEKAGAVGLLLREIPGRKMPQEIRLPASLSEGATTLPTPA